MSHDKNQNITALNINQKSVSREPDNTTNASHRTGETDETAKARRGTSRWTTEPVEMMAHARRSARDTEEMNDELDSAMKPDEILMNLFRWQRPSTDQS